MMDKDKYQNSEPPAGTSGESEDRELEALFSLAGARQAPPAELEQEVRDALHAQWRQAVGGRKRNRAITAFAMAASIALMAVLVRQSSPPQPLVPPFEAVGTIAKRSGSVLIQATETGQPDAAGGQNTGKLYSGYRLETAADSLLALNWSGDESIRMAPGTNMRLLSSTEIELLSGSLYVDSRPGQRDPSHSGPTLTIRTHAGDVRHLGTQFLTNLQAGGVEVSVREGEVAVSSGGTESVAHVGEQLTVSADGEMATRMVPTYGDLWEWTESAAPPIDLDGKTVMEFLQLVARESGRELTFNDANAEDIARRSTLSGSVDLPPMRAMEVILQTTDLVAETVNGSILILAK